MGNIGAWLGRSQLSWRDVSGGRDARLGTSTPRWRNGRRIRTGEDQIAYVKGLAEKIRPFITRREVKSSYLTERFDAARADVMEALALLGARRVDGAFYTMDPA